MAKQVTEALLYTVADILQLTLHRVGDGFKVATDVEVPVGPWNLKMKVLAKSDVLNGDFATFFVYLGFNLWLYIISSNQGKSAKVIVFDGSVVGLSKGMMGTPCEQGLLSSAMDKLKKAHGIAYNLSAAGVWQPSALA